MIKPRIKLKCPKCYSEFVIFVGDLPVIGGGAYLIPWAYMCTNCYTHMDGERIDDLETEK